MTLSRTILKRLVSQQLTPAAQKLLQRLADRVNHDRQKATKPRKTTVHPDAAAYMDAHSLPLPKE